MNIEDGMIKNPYETPEQAMAILELVYPEVISEINDRLDQSFSETDSVMNLKNITLLSNVSRRGSDVENDESDAQMERCLNFYLNSIVTFDENIPYLIELNEHPAYTNTDGSEFSQETTPTSERALWQVAGIVAGEAVSEGENPKNPTYCLYLSAEKLSPDRYEPNITALIKIDSIKSIQSVRDVIYGQSNN